MRKNAKNSPEETTTSGRLKISTNVIASVAKIAASEVSGVVEVLDASGASDQKQSNDIKVKIRGNDASFEISIKIGHGVKIPKVTSDIQASVKNAVESMTGLNVKQVDVMVCGVEEAPAEE